MEEIRAQWAFGKPKGASDAERERGEARFGSRFRKPIYEHAYAEAAVVLFEHASKEGRVSELAQPVLYLQRHTIELLLKDTLRALHQIRSSRRLDADLFGGEPVPEPSETEKKTLAEHDLGALLRRIGNNLELLGFETVPASFTQAVELFKKLEQGDPSRLRYPLNRQGEDSFTSEITVPVKALHDHLKTICRECEIREHPVGESSFAEKFGDELIYEAQIDYRRIEALTTKTKNGELEWKRIPPVEWMPPKDGLAGCTIATTDEHIAVSTTDGRKLVLFPLDGSDALPFAIGVVRATDAAHRDTAMQLSSVLLLERDEGYLVRLAAVAAGILDVDGESVAAPSLSPASPA